MRAREHPLVAFLRDRNEAGGFDQMAWARAVAAAHETGLIARMAAGAEGLPMPRPVALHLEEQSARMPHELTVARYEIGQIAAVFSEAGIPAMLLKGAAYVAGELELSRTRIFEDFDVLVPKSELDAAEAWLRSHDWMAAPKSALDRQYFREWLHEVAPLVHTERNTTLDLHHNILPSTDRLAFDAALLWEAAKRLPRGLWVLGPDDQVLHCAVHLFRNGEFRHGLRDLHDLHLLLSARAAEDESFWLTLLDRARQLSLRQPFALALRYARGLFDTPVPEWAAARTRSWVSDVFCRAFDVLVDRALLPRYRFRTDLWRNRAVTALSYWPVPRFRVMATWLFWAKRFDRKTGLPPA